jgi:hypothetical protein
VTDRTCEDASENASKWCRPITWKSTIAVIFTLLTAPAPACVFLRCPARRRLLQAKVRPRIDAIGRIRQIRRPALGHTNVALGTIGAKDSPTQTATRQLTPVGTRCQVCPDRMNGHCGNGRHHVPSIVAYISERRCDQADGLSTLKEDALF